MLFLEFGTYGTGAPLGGSTVLLHGLTCCLELDVFAGRDAEDVLALVAFLAAGDET